MLREWAYVCFVSVCVAVLTQQLGNMILGMVQEPESSFRPHCPLHLSRKGLNKC